VRISWLPGHFAAKLEQALKAGAPSDAGRHYGVQGLERTRARPARCRCRNCDMITTPQRSGEGEQVRSVAFTTVWSHSVRRRLGGCR
jgi:hypothetical protein